MAVVLTLVQKKQIRISIHKRNNTKNTVQTIQNAVNTSTHITKTPTLCKTHTYTHPHLTKQVKTTTVQDTSKWNSHSIIKYPQYKVTLMYMSLLSQRTSRNSTSLRLKIKSLHINHVSSLHLNTLNPHLNSLACNSILNPLSKSVYFTEESR